MAMPVALSVFLSILNLVAMVSHILGCYLLTCQYRQGSQSPQQIFLINLAVAEAAINFLQVLANHATHEHPPSPPFNPTGAPVPINPINATNTSLHKLPSTEELDRELYIHAKEFADGLCGWQHSVKIVRVYGFITMYFLIMTYLTLDRLFLVLLHLRYPLFWNKIRTIFLLKLTWLVCILGAVSVLIANHLIHIHPLYYADMYVYPSFDIAFLTIATITYAVMFEKYRKSKMNVVQHVTVGSSNQFRPSTIQLFRKSRFYIPMLLITSFVVFMAIPDLVQTFYVTMQDVEDEVLGNVLRILWAMSYLTDAVIYIWLKVSVRELLRRKLGLGRTNRVDVVGTRSRRVTTAT